MLRRIEIESDYLKNSLKGRSTLHFLGPEGEASLYLSVDDLENYKGIKLSFWIEFLMTDYAPIIILYMELKKEDLVSKVGFVYNIKNENDLDELNDMISYRESILNFVQFENQKLFFGFSYIISFNEQFIEEFERIILEASNLSRELKYSFNDAYVAFTNNQAIFKQRTIVSSDYQFFLPQVEEEESITEKIEKEKLSDFDYEGESGILSVKTYKRSVYEKMKNGTLIKDSTNNEDLENKILTLESIIKEKNKDINLLKKENRYLKEELEYLKLDKTRKNWWKFKNNKNPFE